MQMGAIVSLSPICTLWGGFMSRLLEQIYLSPVTKGNSSLHKDVSIQMDASTQTFGKPVTLCSSYPKIRMKKSTQPQNFAHVHKAAVS